MSSKSMTTTKKTKKARATKIITPQQVKSRLLPVYPLKVIDTNSHPLANISEVTRYIYFTPKINPYKASKTAKDTANDDEEIDDDEQEEEERARRSFLVHGTSVISTESDIEQVFSIFGEVQVVFIHHPVNDPLSRVFEVAMEDNEGYNNAIGTHHEACAYIASNSSHEGWNKWMQDYTFIRPDYNALQQQVDLFMMAFDERTARERAQSKKRIVDDEGFILVTSDKNNYKKDRKLAKSRAKRATRKMDTKLREQRDAAVTFYKFHEDERQKREADKLQRQYHRDREKINTMKERRQFNPL